MSSSSSSSSLYMPKGSAATPAQKKKVAVLGAGGYLGGNMFGFLQRASSLYGTGLGGVSTPRSICATSVASDSLNRILSKNFVLAYAGEDMVRLTNMQQVQGGSSCCSIQQRLEGYHAAILGTTYVLEQRPVTSNSYEITPNDKTFEFYLDGPRRQTDNDESQLLSLSVGEEEEKQARHLTFFQNTLEACRLAKLQHLIVVETPQTKDAQQFAKLLDQVGGDIPFTYVRVCGELVNFPDDYTFWKGLQGDLTVESLTLPPGYRTARGYEAGDWMADWNTTTDPTDVIQENYPVVYREDVAALVVQSLMSLDWSASKCLTVKSNGPLAQARTTATMKTSGRPDREWCGNSEILASILSNIQ